MLREATYTPAAVNVLDAFQVFLYGRFWVFTEDQAQHQRSQKSLKFAWHPVRLDQLKNRPDRDDEQWEQAQAYEPTIRK
jgi:hypothetical protein